jgi:hypothetical protein
MKDGKRGTSIWLGDNDALEVAESYEEVVSAISSAIKEAS